MNKKAVQIFLTLGLISSVGIINGCNSETEGGEGIDNGVQQENTTQPQEENPTQPDDGGEGGEG